MTSGTISFTHGENPLRADKLNSGLNERLLAAGDTMLGPLILFRAPVSNFEAATKNYVDGLMAGNLIGYLPSSGGTISGNLTINGVGTALNVGSGDVTIPNGDLTLNNSHAITTDGKAQSGQVIAAKSGGVGGFVGSSNITNSSYAGLQLDNANRIVFGDANVSTGALTVTRAYITTSGDMTLSGSLTVKPSTGTVLLGRDPTAALEAATMQWVNSQIGSVAGIAEAPIDGTAYGRRNGTWSQVLMLTGGTLSGALTLSGDASTSLQPTTLQQLNAKAALYLPLTGGSLSGALTAVSNVTAGVSADVGASLTINAAVATDRLLQFQTVAKNRWVFRTNTTAEGGSNAGSNFSLLRYADDGTTQLGIPLQFVRSTGVATFAQIPIIPTATTGDNTTGAATTAFVQTTVAPYANDAGRNILHNGQFVIGQRGLGPFTANGHTADRWRLNLVTDTASVTTVALTDANRTAIGDEAGVVTLGNVFTGNAAAGAFNVLLQTIEGVRRIANKTVTLSFWAIAGSGTPKLGASFDQVFGTGGAPSATVSSNGQSVTLSTTWTRYTLTFTIPSVSGKTMGSNNDDYSILFFWFSSGSTNNVRSGSVGVQTASINLWGVQLEIGSIATPFEKLETADDLRHCQRHYQVGQLITAGYGAANGQNIYWSSLLSVSMRAVPTIALTPVSTTNCTTFTGGSYSGYAVWMNALVIATNPYVASASFTASAEL